MLSLDQNIVLVFNVLMASHILLGLPNSSPHPFPAKKQICKNSLSFHSHTSNSSQPTQLQSL